MAVEFGAKLYLKDNMYQLFRRSSVSILCITRNPY